MLEEETTENMQTPPDSEPNGKTPGGSTVGVSAALQVNETAVKYRSDVKSGALWQRILAAVIALAFAAALIYVMAALPDFQTWYYILILCILSAFSLFFCTGAIVAAVQIKKSPTILVCDDEKLVIREGMKYRAVAYTQIGKLVVHLGDTFAEYRGEGTLNLELADNTLYYEVSGRTKIVPCPNMLKLAEILEARLAEDNHAAAADGKIL